MAIELAASAGLTVDELSVTDREWDFGSREIFTRWCAVGSTAWTDRVPTGERDVALRARLLSTGDGGTWLLLQRED